MDIVIPSYKRAHRLVGKDYFTMAKYVVPESQRDEYAKAVGADRLIVIPDEQDGSLSRKRNWILKNIPRPLVMIDDDITAIWYWDNRRVQYLRRALESQLLDPFFEQGFQLAEGFGAKMWGLAQNTDDRSYKENQPFSLSLITLGPFSGHLKHGLTYDERMGSKEDYDMALQHMQNYGRVFRWNKFAYDAQQQENEGGAVSFRSIEKEIEWSKAIMRKWGHKIIKYRIPPQSTKDLRNGAVHVPIKGV